MIEAYCDGSCPQPYGIGGWAFVILQEPAIFGSGFADVATNQTMELMAALGCLREIKRQGLRDREITIYSDSQYLVKGMMEWGEGWQDRDYAGVSNPDWWRLLHGHKARCGALTFKWIKGHSGNQWNEYVDKMAGRARRKGVTAWNEACNRVREKA